MLRGVMGGVEKKYPRQGSNNRGIDRENRGGEKEATSDPTSLARTPRNHRPKSTQRRSPTSPPVSRPCRRRPSRPCKRSSVGNLGDHDRRPTASGPPMQSLAHTDLRAAGGMPLARDGCTGKQNGGAPLSFRPRQAAAQLGVSVSTLTRLSRAGRLQRITFGNIVLYRVETLHTFLASHEK
jgi:excisionase family DNA binding protein